MRDVDRRLDKAAKRLERALRRRQWADNFWNRSWLGVFLRRVWWHVLNPTKWPERRPTPQEVAEFRRQLREMPR